VVPATVEVSGPSSRVDGLQVVETEPVNTFVIGQIEREVALTGAGEWLSYSPNRVRVSFAVSEVEGRRTFTDVAVALHSAPAGSTLEPPEIDVTVRGPEHRLMSFKPEDVAPYVDASGLDPGVHSIKPEVAVPEGFEIDGVSPGTLKLHIPKAAQGQGADRASGQNAG